MMGLLPETEAGEEGAAAGVVGAGDGDQAVEAVIVEQVADQASERLGSVTLAPVIGMQAVAELGLTLAGAAEVDADVADDRTIMRLDHILVPARLGARRPPFHRRVHRTSLVERAVAAPLPARDTLADIVQHLGIGGANGADTEPIGRERVHGGNVTGEGWMREIDIAVIGAGAAGIAAARELVRHGLSVRVIEADQRIGGRAWTKAAGGHPLDLGCGWLHSADRNPWRKLAEAAGFTIDRTPPPWGTQVFDHGFPADEQAAFQAAFAAFEERLDKARDKPDAPAGRYHDGGRWDPLIDALSSYISGAEYDRISAHDYLAYSDADTGVNWRCVEGYGALIAAQAAGIDVTLATPVSAIDWSGTGVRIETLAGTIAAKAAVVTVPTPIIAAEQLRFVPGLPDKVEAASRLPLGLANKVVLALDGAEEFPKDSQLFGRTDTSATGAYHLRPFGRPLIEAFLGGRHADDLEAAGPGVATAFAVDELVGQFGSGFARRLTPLSETRWRAQPWIGGSYSYAEPGCAAMRQTLVAPVADKLFFAGEACSHHDFSTAHGAYETGVAAAVEVLAALGIKSPAS